MKKKILALTLSVLMAASLAGCSKELSNEYITVKQYEGLEVPKVEQSEVTDESVESTINSTLSSKSTSEEIKDRAAKEGDTVNIDYKGSVDGVEFEGGSATGASLELGSNSFIGANGDYKGFEEQIVGHKIGEKFDIEVKFPSDYKNTEMADKVAVFNITLNGISVVTVPELTDDWVKENSEESKTVEEYKKEIQKQLDDGIDYAAGKINVIQLLERYISIKQGVRYNTKVGYNFVLNLVKKEDFGYRSIRDIKVSDAQKWIVKLHEDGKGYSTLTSVRGVVKPAFQMAYNEDVIRRNPFDFKLIDVVSNDSQKRIAMTEEQQKLWMDFIRTDKTYCKYYDEFVVLLGTGMRVSEFCGLTKADLDFAGRKIRVDHQLVRERGGKYYVEKTKTECGCRYIPMTDEVYRSLQNILSLRKRVKTETIIDGYSGFLLLDKNDSPKVALHIENEMRWAMKKYQKLHPDKPDAPLPHITPHVFRHTFCTNMANAGMDIKTLQYVMGHSDVGVTLNVYTHASYDRAAEQMAKIIDFKGLAAPEPQRKSG